MGCGCSDDLSQEIKQEITARSLQGFSATIIAAQLGVQKKAVEDWLAKPAEEPIKVKSFKKKSKKISTDGTDEIL